MTEQTIAIYCFIDDFFITIGRKEDVHCKLSDAEILTTALLAACYFHGNLSSACSYMQQHHGVRMIDKSAPPAPLAPATVSLVSGLERYDKTTQYQLSVPD